MQLASVKPISTYKNTDLNVVINLSCHVALPTRTEWLFSSRVPANKHEQIKLEIRMSEHYTPEGRAVNRDHRSIT